jgi:hypothetical protein
MGAGVYAVLLVTISEARSQRLARAFLFLEAAAVFLAGRAASGVGRHPAPDAGGAQRSCPRAAPAGNFAVCTLT